MNKLHFVSLDSTNNYLKNNYQNLENYTFVSADVQSDGKGRNNRVWISENGKNLLFSLLLLDRQLYEHFKEISIVTAYVIIKELEKIGLDNLKIKWPNDIYVGDKKICGILLEAITKKDIECLIVGVGLNVNEDSFIGEYRAKPTSIKNELKNEINIDILKDKIYVSLVNALEEIKNGKEFYYSIKEYDYLVNKNALYNGEEVLVIGINKDYSLKIDCNGKLIDVDFDEIVL